MRQQVTFPSAFPSQLPLVQTHWRPLKSVDPWIEAKWKNLLVPFLPVGPAGGCDGVR